MAKTLEEYRTILAKGLEEQELLGDFDLDGLIDELSNFGSTELPEMKPGARYVTAAIVSSESGDTDLFLGQGLLTARDIAVDSFLLSPTWWYGFENMNVYDVKHLEVGP